MLSPTTAPVAAESDHELDAEVTRARDDAGRDRRRLARHEREEGVDHRDREDDEIAPVGARDRVDDTLEHRGILAETNAMRPVPFLPLTGVRVLDVTTSIAGPYCASDPRRARRRRDQGRAAGHGRRRPRLGAAVLEADGRQAGDDVPLRQRGQALARALAAGAARAATRFSASSTAPTSSSRASARGSRSELGLGAGELRERNSRLVYCSVGAYGRVGPQREEPGYDALMQAAGGLISMTGEPGRPGVRVGSSLIDQGTGTWAALGILAALLEREQTGEGREVDVSLYETAIGYIGLPPRRLPRRRHGADRAGNAVPDGRALPGDRAPGTAS